jgi:hypothetical protein
MAEAWGVEAGFDVAFWAGLWAKADPAARVPARKAASRDRAGLKRGRFSPTTPISHFVVADETEHFAVRLTVFIVILTSRESVHTGLLYL